MEDAWLPARKVGALGDVSVKELYEHAKGFVLSVWRDAEDLNLVDMGSGVGVPGILLALQLPQTRWTLVDSSLKRCDIAEIAVQRLRLEKRVAVEHARLDDFAQANQGGFDGGVARLFGTVSELAECGLLLLKVGASLVTSVSDDTRAEWGRSNLKSLTGCELRTSWEVDTGQFAAVERVSVMPNQLPRSASVRKRTPLLG